MATRLALVNFKHRLNGNVLRELAFPVGVVLRRLAAGILTMAALLGMFLLKPQPVGAASSRSGIQVSPLSFEQEVSPGEEFSFPVRFFNPLGKEQTIRPVFRDLLIDEQGRVQFLDYSSRRYTVSRWADFDRIKMTLAPEEERLVDVRFRIPEDATVGSHFGAFFADVRSGEGDSFSPYQVKQHVSSGVLVFLSVVREGIGESGWKGEVTNFSVTGGRKIGPFVVSTKPLSFSALFSNQGFFHQNVWGGLEITSGGRRIHAVPLQEKKALPGQVVGYNTEWKPSSPVGRFQATLEIRYGRDGGELDVREASFLVVDPRIFWAVVVGFVLYLVWRIRRNLVMDSE